MTCENLERQRPTTGVDVKLWNEFTKLVGALHGNRKGATGECLDEALGDWIKKSRKRINK